MKRESVMDISLLKHMMEGMVARNEDSMFGVLAGMLLAVINDVIEREGIRDEIKMMDTLFYGMLKTDQVQEMREKMKEAIQNGGEEDAKKYLASIYLLKKKAEEERK